MEAMTRFNVGDEVVYLSQREHNLVSRGRVTRINISEFATQIHDAINGEVDFNKVERCVNYEIMYTDAQEGRLRTDWVNGQQIFRSLTELKRIIEGLVMREGDNERS